MKPEIDEISGQNTTGHEWDGIKELDTPLPKPMLIWLVASIAVAVLMWILYPSFPSLSGYLNGTAGYSSRLIVDAQVKDGQAQRQEAYQIFAQNDLETLATDDTLKARFGESIGVLYRDNCGVCHGRDLQGQPGFPDLTDDHWLWSGTPEEIEFTLQHGINHTSDDTRYGEMPAFGRDEMLEKSDIKAVIEYVLQISGSDHDAELAAAGAGIFEENCASCHNDEGIGGYENGAPSLVDAAWIYGGTRHDLQETLKYGRAGVMPGWQDRLSSEEIKMLTLYVLWAGQDHGAH